jgi:hypothetical protein
MFAKVVVFPAMFSLVAFGFISQPSEAKTVSTKGHSQVQVKSSCTASGGVYSGFTPGSKGGTWGCLNPDGNGIVCGGTGDNYKNTCDTFRGLPPRLPTRAEVSMFEKFRRY